MISRAISTTDVTPVPLLQAQTWMLPPLHYLEARMIGAGSDPGFIARRLIVHARRISAWLTPRPDWLRYAVCGLFSWCFAEARWLNSGAGDDYLAFALSNAVGYRWALADVRAGLQAGSGSFCAMVTSPGLLHWGMVAAMSTPHDQK